jgi:integrase
MRYGGPKKSIAQQKRAATHALLAGGVPIEEVLAQVYGDFHGSRLTFRDAAEPYLEYAKPRKKPSTYARDARRLEYLKRQPWAKHYLAKIRPDQLAGHVSRRLAEGASAGTINREIALVGALFKWALQMRYVKGNPVRGIEKPSEQDNDREVYLAAKEARTFVAKAPSQAFAGLLTAALSTGLRKGELRELLWPSVDLKAGTLRVKADTSKTRKFRVIRLTAALTTVLRRLKAERKVWSIDGSDPVFADERGQPWQDHTIRHRFEATRRACGGKIPAAKLGALRFHDLRHTAASLMVGQGIPLYDVGRVLGHKTPSMTARYSHFAPRAGRAAIGALGRALGL